MTNNDARRGEVPWLDSLTKGAVAVIGVVYTFGLMVATLHLASYGASGLGLLRAQYVLAGVWVLFPLAAVAFVIVLIAGFALHEFADPPHVERSAGAPASTPDRARFSFKKVRLVLSKLRDVLASVVGWIVIAVFFLGFVTRQFSASDGATFGFVELLVLGLKVTGFSVAMTLFAFGGWGLLRRPGADNALFGTIAWAAAVVAILGYVGFFSASVYPRIPAALGGGHPTLVQLLLKTDSIVSVPKAINGADTLTRVRCHKLLLASNNTYILIDPRDSTSALQISNELVAAVRTVADRRWCAA